MSDALTLSKCQIKHGMGVASEISLKMAPIKGLMPRPEWQWKVLKLLILALCLILFVWQFSYIFKDYLDVRSTITSEQGQCCQIAKSARLHYLIRIVFTYGLSDPFRMGTLTLLVSQ